MLDEFIVLGLVPGTQLQITFDTWIIISGSLASVIGLWRTYRAETLQRVIITGRIFALTHRRLPQHLSV